MEAVTNSVNESLDAKKSPTRWVTEEDIYEEVQEDAEGFDEYTCPLWNYESWEVPEILSRINEEIPRQYYKALQHSLFETGFPETQDKTSKVKTFSHQQVSITVLSSPVECLSVLLEGGEQCPGNMLLVLSDSWLSKEPSSTQSSKFSLYVNKAIAFYKGGHTCLEMYQPPRRVTYFVNFFTANCTGNAHTEGEDLEQNLDCPMSSSLKLLSYTDNKLLTRTLAAQAGVPYPTTLAFIKHSNVVLNTRGLRITVQVIPENISDKQLQLTFKDKIETFLATHSFSKLVIKPSGPSWFGSKLVSFNKPIVEELVETAVSVYHRLEEGDAVILEECIDNLPVTEDYNFRVRTTVCRTSDDLPHVSKTVCGVAKSCKPINGDNTIPQSLEASLKTWHVSEENIKDIKNKLISMSERTLKAIMSFDESLNEDERGGIGAQTDIIGLDFLVRKNQSKFEPVLIEVNGHDCMINCQINEFINKDKIGEAAKELVNTMISRSERFLVKGKTVLFVGDGSYGKRFTLKDTRDYGIKIVLVNTEKPKNLSQDITFIPHDLTDLKRTYKNATEIIAKLQARGITIDGCITFWDENVRLAAAICELLNLTGSNYKACTIAKNKYLTFKWLQKRKGDIPHWPRTFLYSSNVYEINTQSDISKIFQNNKPSLPLVLKLEYGSSAVGVKLVQNEEECQQYYQQLSDLEMSGVGLCLGRSFILMDYLQGTEHDVDIIIYKRKLIAAFVSDNGPTRLPNFTETAALLPSILSDEKQNQLIVAAYQCCLEIGLESGVFNVEMIMSVTGPKLCEINSRMGGIYLRDWIKFCYGVDIMFCVLLISLGIEPHVKCKYSQTYLAGIMCLASEHAHIFKDKQKMNLIRAKHESKKIRYNQFLEKPLLEDKEEEPFSSIAAVEPDPITAKKSLIKLSEELGIKTDSYNVEQFLKFIPNKTQE
ncbi:carnosine synthase 1 [Octopus sinensis]|uniref:Carnosine synthase 1 n=1 Tax=Octopus sinensis TaxID=2607531 RepID=A0A6P7TAU2_9MOLL|nr:carnosine synthase 1 [Octopus sinensis]XP_029646821.1 carnosine synthase 1 [Octopus sinensis]